MSWVGKRTAMGWHFGQFVKCPTAPYGRGLMALEGYGNETPPHKLPGTSDQHRVQRA